MEPLTPQDVRKIVVVGHVDHGKSTLLGRILLDCGRIPDEKVESVRKVCQSKGIQFEPAFFFDALQEEQEQGVSIDTTRVNFEFDGRRFLLIDAPGHLEFLKNMTSGASEADFGIVVVDSHEGVRAQTGRHLRVLAILGIKDVLVAVNKLDKAGYDRAVFDEVSACVRELAAAEGLRCLDVIPISALHGENITTAATAIPWYSGQALLPLLCELTDGRLDFAPEEEPFRMVLQDVYRFNEERYFAGRVLAGSIASGAEICFSPSGKISKIEAIEVYPARNVGGAVKGDSVALRLSEQVFVERGEIVSLVHEIPEIDTELRARLAWLGAEPFDPSAEYIVKVGTDEARCALTIIGDQNGESGKEGMRPGNGDFADVVIKASKPLAFDRDESGRGISKLVVCSTYETVAAGVVDSRPVRAAREPAVNPHVVVETGYVARDDYEGRQGHPGAVIWMTGLSGAGKSTLARAVEHKLFNDGYRAVVLDGDNLRSGLCADLGFSPEDRSENIRRIAHVSKLFLDSGNIVIVACISPYEQDRELARAVVGPKDFSEVFVYCPIEVCQQRDPKGLYKKTSSGHVTNMTGFTSPYQPPREPDLRLDSSELSVEREVEMVVQMLRAKAVVAAGAGVAIPSVSAREKPAVS